MVINHYNHWRQVEQELATCQKDRNRELASLAKAEKKKINAEQEAKLAEAAQRKATTQ